MSNTMVLISIGIMALVTALLRFAPFLIFNGNRKTPNYILFLGRVLPCAIMGMLVVYCLKNTSFSSLSGWLPYLISIIIVVMLHLWKRNTLISIVSGTISYMFLIQFVFNSVH